MNSTCLQLQIRNQSWNGIAIKTLNTPETPIEIDIHYFSCGDYKLI